MFVLATIVLLGRFRFSVSFSSLANVVQHIYDLTSRDDFTYISLYIARERTFDRRVRRRRRERKKNKNERKRREQNTRKYRGIRRERDERSTKGTLVA